MSPRTGIIRSVSRSAKSIEDPDLPIVCQALLSNFDFKRAAASDRMSAGKGLTEADAVAGAIGEALERDCGCHHQPRLHRVATAEELGPTAIRPEEFVLYSEPQYAGKTLPYARPDPARPITWIRCVQLPDHGEVYAPASLVYFDFAGQDREDFFTTPTSSGLAAGPGVEHAVLAGLCELIERDAFLVTWMNRLAVPAVDVRGVAGVAAAACRHFRRFGIEVTVLNVTTDLAIPAMMAIAVDRSGSGPAAVVGLGCHLDPATAVTKAVSEIVQVRPGQVRRLRERAADHRPLRAYQDVRTLPDHADFFSSVERLDELSFLLEPRVTQDVRDLPNHWTGDVTSDLTGVVERLRAAGSRVAYADLTTPDLAGFNFHIVRTIASGLQPIHFGYGEERLGGARLFEAPARMGYGDRARTEQELNPCPHPIA